MGRLTIIRDLVFDKIKDTKTASGYSFNDFELEKTYFPVTKLEDLNILPNGKVYIIGLAFDTDGPVARTYAGAQSEIPIQVVFQKTVKDPRDVTELDPLVNFVEELEATCRLEVVNSNDEDEGGPAPKPYQWLRSTSLKDENEVPFAYVGLREASVFEAWFNAFYLRLLEGHT